MQVHELFATSAVVGFACIDGRPIGVVANQPNVRAGILDVDASEKVARFVRLCDSFNLPVITLVDTPDTSRAPIRSTPASSAAAPR